MRHQSRGFSMLELMIVLAISAILAMVAIPGYRLYIDKAKFSEVTQAVMPYKAAVEVCSHMLGGLGDGKLNCGTPGSNGIPKDYFSHQEHSYLESIQVRYQAPNVIIKAQSQHLAKNASYVLQGYLNSYGELEWQVDPISTCLEEGLCHSL